MSPITIYAALGLSASGAILSGLYHRGDTQQKVLWLLEAIGSAQPSAMAGAVGEESEFPVSP